MTDEEHRIRVMQEFYAKLRGKLQDKKKADALVDLFVYASGVPKPTEH